MHHLKRREFVGVLASMAAWPSTAFAQATERIRRVGVVMAYAEDDPNGHLQAEAFQEHLRTLGWIQGKNFTVDIRYASGDASRARELAVELLQQTPDVMVWRSASPISTLVRSSNINPGYQFPRRNECRCAAKNCA